MLVKAGPCLIVGNQRLQRPLIEGSKNDLHWWPGFFVQASSHDETWHGLSGTGCLRSIGIGSTLVALATAPKVWNLQKGMGHGPLKSGSDGGAKGWGSNKNPRKKGLLWFEMLVPSQPKASSMRKPPQRRKRHRRSRRVVMVPHIPGSSRMRDHSPSWYHKGASCNVRILEFRRFSHLSAVFFAPRTRMHRRPLKKSCHWG